MKILVVNDDGINAQGLKVLVSYLSKHFLSENIKVVAPDKVNSGVSHKLTFDKELEFKRVDIFGKDILAYSLTGTPADCVITALNFLFKDIDFDVVISGINKGANLGSDLVYSGTVAGAREALFNNVSGVSVSLQYFCDREVDRLYYDTAAKYIVEFLETNFTKTIDYLYNINVPNVDYKEIKGVKYGFCNYKLADIREIKQLSENKIIIHGRKFLPEKEGSDLYFIKRNYITISKVLPYYCESRGDLDG